MYRYRIPESALLDGDAVAGCWRGTSATAFSGTLSTLPLNVERTNQGGFTFDDANDQVYIPQSGIYLVGSFVTAQKTSGSANHQIDLGIYIDEGAGYSVIPGSQYAIELRVVGRYRTHGLSIPLYMNEGDAISVQARISTGSDSQMNSQLLHITRLGA